MVAQRQLMRHIPVESLKGAHQEHRGKAQRLVNSSMPIIPLANLMWAVKTGSSLRQWPPRLYQLLCHHSHRSSHRLTEVERSWLVQMCLP